MPAPTPRLLFENVLELGTLTVTTEVAGWPKENALDWRLGTAYRYRGSSGVSSPHHVTVDLGASLSIAADTFVLGGSNLIDLDPLGGAWYQVEWSNNGSAWTAVSDVMWAAPDGYIADKRPRFVRFPGAGAHRYWRVSLYSGKAFSEDPQAACLTVGRSLSLEGVPPSLDLLSEEAEIEYYDNEHGNHVGACVESPRKRLELEYTEAGLAVSTVFRPASGLSVDVDLRAHLSTDRPFWMLIDRGLSNGLSGGSPDPVPGAEVWLCRARNWSMPFRSTTARRSLRVSMEAYREIA